MKSSNLLIAVRSPMGRWSSRRRYLSSTCIGPLTAALAAGLLAGCAGESETQVVDCWLLEPAQLVAAAEDGQCLDAFARYVEEVAPTAGGAAPVSGGEGGPAGPSGGAVAGVGDTGGDGSGAGSTDGGAGPGDAGTGNSGTGGGSTGGT